jgi:hypothetical protein
MAMTLKEEASQSSTRGDGSSTGMSVPLMWVLLRLPQFRGAQNAGSDANGRVWQLAHCALGDLQKIRDEQKAGTSAKITFNNPIITWE